MKCSRKCSCISPLFKTVSRCVISGLHSRHFRLVSSQTQMALARSLQKRSTGRAICFSSYILQHQALKNSNSHYTLQGRSIISTANCGIVPDLISLNSHGYRAMTHANHGQHLPCPVPNSLDQSMTRRGSLLQSHGQLASD
jgi:hypothetical protein